MPGPVQAGSCDSRSRSLLSSTLAGEGDEAAVMSKTGRQEEYLEPSMQQRAACVGRPKAGMARNKSSACAGRV